MDERGVLERVKVREVTGVFSSRAAATPAVDELLLAGFDRADIDAIAEGEPLRKRIGRIPVPAVELADVPVTPRQEFIMPEDVAGVFALWVSVMGCFGAMIGAAAVIASGGTTAGAVIAAVVGGGVGCTLGGLIAKLWRRRWTRASGTPPGTDGLVLWVRVRTPDREQKALHILTVHGGRAVRVHEIVIEKRLEDLPLSSLRPDPWLGNERLGEP
jgi:hypothetical protein